MPWGLTPIEAFWFPFLSGNVANKPLWNDISLCSPSARFQLKGYLGERRGEREDMQDAHTIIDDLTPQFMSLPNNM